MNNYKRFSELKEELGNNYDFKLYEMGISALKEIENLQQENKKLKMIVNEYERLNKGFKITDVQKYNIDELLSYKKYKDNWDELKEYLHNVDVVVDYSENYDGHFINYDELIDKMQKLEQGSDSNEI